jgi:hypothetical protein
MQVVKPEGESGFQTGKSVFSPERKRTFERMASPELLLIS